MANLGNSFSVFFHTGSTSVWKRPWRSFKQNKVFPWKNVFPDGALKVCWQEILGFNSAANPLSRWDSAWITYWLKTIYSFVFLIFGPENSLREMIFALLFTGIVSLLCWKQHSQWAPYDGLWGHTIWGRPCNHFSRVFFSHGWCNDGLRQLFSDDSLQMLLPKKPMNDLMFTKVFPSQGNF